MMNTSYKNKFALIFALFCWVLTAFAEPGNISLLKNEIKKYYDSGLYIKEVQQVASQAKDYILTQIKLNEQLKHPQKLAIVLDIDETSLSNYYKIIKRDFWGNPKEIHQEIIAANSPAIAPILALYQMAKHYGIHVFFVSGRTLSESAATSSNLRSAGFKNWDGIYLRPANYQHTSIAPFKAKIRQLITQQGYLIVASIGDQCSDLTGGYMLKGFKLPNPFYYIP